MLEMLYSGFVYGGYFQGWLDQITSKGGYLVTITNMAITVESAYYTALNDKDGWELIQAGWQT